MSLSLGSSYIQKRGINPSADRISKDDKPQSTSKSSSKIDSASLGKTIKDGDVLSLSYEGLAVQKQLMSKLHERSATEPKKENVLSTFKNLIEIQKHDPSDISLPADYQGTHTGSKEELTEQFIQTKLEGMDMSQLQELRDMCNSQKNTEDWSYMQQNKVKRMILNNISRMSSEKSQNINAAITALIDQQNFQVTLPDMIKSYLPEGMTNTDDMDIIKDTVTKFLEENAQFLNKEMREHTKEKCNQQNSEWMYANENTLKSLVSKYL